MRPRLFTLRNLALILAAALVFGGLSYWIRAGMPLPGNSVPSTAGKIAFLSTRSGHSNLWMMNGADGGDAVALTTEAVEDSEPAWSKTGSEIAFTSAGRAGATRQIFYMDARPGGRVLALTNTSMSKASPFFGPERRIFYLAAGRVAATNPENKDADLIFPEADTVRALYGDSEHPGLLSTGGVVRMVGSDNGTMAIVIKTEEGQALLLVDTTVNAGALLGVGQTIYPQFLPDGRLFVLYQKGDSLPKMVSLFDEKSAKAGGAVPTVEALFAQSHFSPPSAQGTSVVTYDIGSGDIKKLGALPFIADDFALAPNGAHFVLGFKKPIEAGQGQTIGLVVLPTDPATQDQPTVVFPDGAAQPSWSPDSGQIAFVAGKDIMVVPAAGGEAKNLTKGQGENSAPLWSPAKAEKK